MTTESVPVIHTRKEVLDSLDGVSRFCCEVLRNAGYLIVSDEKPAEKEREHGSIKVAKENHAGSDEIQTPVVLGRTFRGP